MARSTDERAAGEAPLTADEARELVGRARFHAEALLEIALRLYRGRAHLALGYRSWWSFACEELGCASKSAAYDLSRAAAVRAESIAAAAGSGNPDWRAGLGRSQLVALAPLELAARDRVLTDLERAHPDPRAVTVEAVWDARRRYEFAGWAGVGDQKQASRAGPFSGTAALGPPPADYRLTAPAAAHRLRLPVGGLALGRAQALWDRDVALHGENRWVPRPVSEEAESLEESIRCAAHHAEVAAALHRPELTGHSLPALIGELPAVRAEEVRRGLRAAQVTLAAVEAALSDHEAQSYRPQVVALAANG